MMNFYFIDSIDLSLRTEPTNVHYQQQQQNLLKSQVSTEHVVVNKQNLDGSLASSRNARIIKQDMEVNPDGSHFNVWNSDNGIDVQEQTVVQQVDDVVVPVSQGEISYVDNEGTHYHLTYVADQFGFRVKGDHLPTPPPLPAGIARGLEYIKAHPYVEPTDYKVWIIFFFYHCDAAAWRLSICFLNLV